MSRRTPARYLAPLALVGFAIALVAVVNGSRVEEPATNRPAAERNADAVYSRLSRDVAAPVVDLRDLAVPDDFVEGVHLTAEGAARFTRAFEQELLPFLEGKPLEERWPVGTSRPTAEARRSLSLRETGY